MIGYIFISVYQALPVLSIIIYVKSKPKRKLTGAGLSDYNKAVCTNRPSSGPQQSEQ